MLLPAVEVLMRKPVLLLLLLKPHPLLLLLPPLLLDQLRHVRGQAAPLSRHSHLENKLRQTLPVGEISQQVSFGYDNKRRGKVILNAFPNVPILFSYDDDPLRFQSLRCFLLIQQQQRGKDVNSVPRKCLGSPISNTTY